MLRSGLIIVGELFADLTKNLAGTGRSIGIFLDNQLISAPTVGPEFASTGITGGSAVITGRFTAQEANDLGVQRWSLTVPVEIVENRTVGATWGETASNVHLCRSWRFGFGIDIYGVLLSATGLIADLL